MAVSINEQGEYFISRKPHEIKKSSSKYLCSCRYLFKTSRKIILNARVMDNVSGKIISSARATVIIMVY